jgi:nucleoside-diphosphate-sugar epimerase
VDDLIEGICRYMLWDPGQQPIPLNGHAPEPVRLDPPVMNLGNPEEITMLDLAREVIAMTGSRSRIAFLPLPSDDPKIRRPDITRARQFLRWSPRVSRAVGLRWTTAYFSQELGLLAPAAQRHGEPLAVKRVPALSGRRPRTLAVRPA